MDENRKNKEVRTFFELKKGSKTFSVQNKGAKTFFDEKFFLKTQPRYPVNVERNSYKKVHNSTLAVPSRKNFDMHNFFPMTFRASDNYSIL